MTPSTRIFINNNNTLLKGLVSNKLYLLTVLVEFITVFYSYPGVLPEPLSFIIVFIILH